AGGRWAGCPRGAGGGGAGPGVPGGGPAGRLAARTRQVPHAGAVVEVFQRHGPPLAVAERDPPVRVLVRGAGQVLRPTVPHGIGERHPDQRGRGAREVAVERAGELLAAHRPPPPPPPPP